MKSNLSFDSVPENVCSILNKLDFLLQEVQAIKPKSQTNSQLLSVKETAALLDLKVSTVYSKICRNELPHIKKGGKVYFLKTDLMAYLESGRKLTQQQIQEQASHFFNSKNTRNHGK